MGLTVTKDVVVSGKNTGTGPAINQSITIGANSNRVLVVDIMMINLAAVPGLTAVTFNGVAMTLDNSSVQTSGAQSLKVWRYYMVAPPTGANNLAITTDASAAVLHYTAYSAYNVDQIIPLGTTLFASGVTNFMGGACVSKEGAMALGSYATWYNTSGSQTIRNQPAWQDNSSFPDNASNTTFTLTGQPSSRLLGCLDVAVLITQNATTHATASSGWSLITTLQQNSKTVSVWGRIYDGTNVNPVFTWTGAAVATGGRFSIVNNNPDSVAEAIALLDTPGQGNAATHTSTGANTTQNNVMVFYLDVVVSSNATALATATGYTERFDTASSSSTCRWALGSKEVATSGTASGNNSHTGSANDWVQFQFEVYTHPHGPPTQEATQLTANFGGTSANDDFETYTWSLLSGDYAQFSSVPVGTGQWVNMTGAILPLDSDDSNSIGESSNSLDSNSNENDTSNSLDSNSPSNAPPEDSNSQDSNSHSDDPVESSNSLDSNSTSNNPPHTKSRRMAIGIASS